MEIAMSKVKYLGIDLGTSNSAVAVFCDGEFETLLNSRGEINNPSVVRVSSKGIVVGAKAKKHLYTDPSNTFKEFKRLMGLESLSAPDLNGQCWSAEQLSAEVLKSLKQMAEEQCQCRFDKVVITVPALFELPQSKATAEAARLAGFDQVELLPEPVASGLAAGWGDSENHLAWLVYDLGGGTFDASLLESREGLLRVVAHDGDNYLGGRDIDRVIVQWLLEQLEQQHKFVLDKDSEQYAGIIRYFESVAEVTKIRLSTTQQSLLELEFEYQDEDYEFDLDLSRQQLKQLCDPIVQRSIDLCLKLLKDQGLDRQRLERVVLVGGPAHMPIIQQLVAERLAPVAELKQDPMALVAQGAAVYAATVKLACSSPLDQQAEARDQQLWLQYPSICTELTPLLMGRVIDPELKLSAVKIRNPEKSWHSEKIDIDDSGIFSVELSISPGSKNKFEVQGFNQQGDECELGYQAINIVHGMTMSDPPLARSIGLALADGSVKIFIERGTPLPAKRTFIQSTVEVLNPNSGQKLEIPIIQGERRQSRFCRKVGSLVIDSKDLNQSLYVGSPVEVTIEVDRGGNLKAHALLAEQGKLIEGVAQLTMASANIEHLRATTNSLNSRISERLQTAFRERDDKAIKVLDPLNTQLNSLLRQMSNIDQDEDACQRASRQLMELEVELELLEAEAQLGDLLEECEDSYFSACGIVNEHGDGVDKRILADCAKQLEQAYNRLRQGEIERLIERLDKLYQSAHEKSPDRWKDNFLYWASLVNVANKPKRANSLVEKGRAEIEAGRTDKLRGLTQELYQLIPEQYKSQGGPGSHDSGVY